MRSFVGYVNYSAQSLPSGAIGIWNAADYISASKTIPNSAVSAPRDTNLLKAPRRMFNRGGWWGPYSSVSVTDANTAAPDGTNDATTVTAGGGTPWSVQGQNANLGNALTIGQTYTAWISVRSLSGGNLDFAFGHDAVTSTFTATPTWQRFSFAFVASTTTVAWIFKTPNGVQNANFAICDWQAALGSTDPHPNWATEAPQSFLNMDIVLDRDASSVSGGAFQHGSHGLIQMATGAAITPSAYTFMYVAKETGTPTQGNFDAIIATLELGTINFNTFAVGPSVSDEVGVRMNNATLDANPAGGGVNIGAAPNTWGGCGGGPYVGLHRYDGIRTDAFINGVKLLGHTISATPVTFADLGVGYLNTTWNGSNDLYYMAYWPRALSDAEVLQAYSAVGSKVALGPPRTVVVVGTSISIFATTYALQIGPLLNPPTYGSSWGVSGQNLAALASAGALVDSTLVGAPAQRMILSVDIGANDLGHGNSSAFLTSLAAYHDARRAAGWKTVATTIMARLDAADGGVQFNLDRAAANATIRTWVGTHCDAVADWAADPTMGTDTSPNNTTYFMSDKIHPTTAGYTILAGITAPAINSVP